MVKSYTDLVIKKTTTRNEEVMALYALDYSDVKEISANCKACGGTMIGTRHYDHVTESGVHVFTSYWTDIARLDENTSVLTWLCRDEGSYSRTTMNGLNEWFDRLHVAKHLSINDVRRASSNGFSDEIIFH
jgi:hypothetical protein